jgi:23S rRNA (guanosine2251-2'-O)-methyltransferase
MRGPKRPTRSSGGRHKQRDPRPSASTDTAPESHAERHSGAPRDSRFERRPDSPRGAPPERSRGAPRDSGQGSQPRIRGPHAGFHSAPQRRPGTEYLYGINPVLRALGAGRRKLYRLWLKDGRLSEGLAELHAAMAAHGLPIGELSGGDLTVLAGTDSHQGAVLECGPLPLGSEEEALALLRPDATGDSTGTTGPARGLPLLVMLDQVEDPQNFGAIVRTCAVFGASGAIVPRHHAAPASPAASKASAGELEAFPIFEASNLSRFLEASQARGAWSVATVTEGGDPLASFKRDSPLVLVVGNEGRGVRPLVERHCDFKLTIPVRPGTSLNVSAATAVVLYALTTTAAQPRPGILAPPPRPDQDETEVV